MSLTFAQLENMGDVIAAAVKTVFEANTSNISMPVYDHRYLGEMNVNRIEVSATGFSRASDQMVKGDNEGWYYAHRRGSIDVSVVTARNDQATTDSHDLCVGRARYLLSRSAQKLTSTALSGLEVLDLIDNGATRSIDERTDLDRTTVSFQIDVLLTANVINAAYTLENP